ncbi:MAG: acylphosphatase [Verrucomicrobiales bacterium]|jgi:acylphosphatase|nr:acylphosphatase [Verrucomicrobiales bacterium]MBT6451006.1 acylphosphatase [Verrucomicrobiales bacterium]MDE2713122.1 acylphosphatase [Verrucomicrobiota bacterium]|tara:strand:+ start:69 stop:344 length:276 start_codon:yes stop_codon:yes gene_type:complete
MPERLQVLFSGHVQGIGFRYTVKQTALGFEVTGWVKNLADGRVELLVEGEREELEAFQAAIPEAGLRRFIRETQAEWSNGTGEFRGFEIAR